MSNTEILNYFASNTVYEYLGSWSNILSVMEDKRGTINKRQLDGRCFFVSPENDFSDNPDVVQVVGE